jgi:hypothetical protein
MKKNSKTGYALSNKNQKNQNQCQGRRINGCIVNGEIYARTMDFTRDTWYQLIDKLYNPNYQKYRQIVEDKLATRHSKGTELYSIFNIENYMKKKNTTLLNKIRNAGKKSKKYNNILTLNEIFLKNLKKSLCRPQSVPVPQPVQPPTPISTEINIGKMEKSAINVYNTVYNYYYSTKS